jgi:hypothetical protein
MPRDHDDLTLQDYSDFLNNGLGTIPTELIGNQWITAQTTEAVLGSPSTVNLTNDPLPTQGFADRTSADLADRIAAFRLANADTRANVTEEPALPMWRCISCHARRPIRPQDDVCTQCGVNVVTRRASRMRAARDRANSGLQERTNKEQE